MKAGKWVIIAALLGLVLGTVPVVGQVTVVWGEDNELATLDPRITQSRHELQVIRQIFDSLITLDENGKPVPWLAESWEIAPDYTWIQFKLREGIKFHDGTPCNAEAFKFTYDSIANPELGSQAAIDYLGPYKETVVIDELTFRVVFTKPYAGMLSAFALSYLAPVSPTAIREHGDAWFSEHPIGTGPFKFVEWVRRDHVTLEKNPDYNWAPANALHQGPPYIDRLVFKIIPENSTRVAALETGEIQVGDLIPPIDVQSFASDPAFKVMLGRVAGVPVSMYLNTSRSPTDELAVRRAVFYALDRDRIVENVFFGFYRAAKSILAQSTPCYWEGAEDLYPYDPARAEEILEQAGWVDRDGDGIREKDGKRLEIYCPIIFKPDLMTAIQAELRKVGVLLKVDNVTKAMQDELIMNNQYEAGLVRWVATDPSVLRIILHSSNIPAPGYFKFNWQRYASEEIDRLLDEAEAAPTPQERCAIYERIQQIVLEQALIVPLQETTQTVVYDARLEGLRWEVGNYQVLFYDVKVTGE